MGPRDFFRRWFRRRPDLPVISEAEINKLVERTNNNDREAYDALNKVLDEASFPNEASCELIAVAVADYELRGEIDALRQSAQDALRSLRQAEGDPGTTIEVLLNMARNFNPEHHRPELKQVIRELDLGQYTARLPHTAWRFCRKLCEIAKDGDHPAALRTLYDLHHSQGRFVGLAHYLDGPIGLPEDWDTLLALHWRALCWPSSSEPRPTLEWFSGHLVQREILSRLPNRFGDLRRYIGELFERRDLVKLVQFLAWCDSHKDFDPCEINGWTLVQLQRLADELCKAELQRRRELPAAD
jgi:hypothetical protein